MMMQCERALIGQDLTNQSSFTLQVIIHPFTPIHTVIAVATKVLPAHHDLMAQPSGETGLKV